MANQAPDREVVLMKSRLSSVDERSWRFWFVALLLPTILMLPVLWSPHYGLFSDAGQIIEFPREVLDGLPMSLKLLRPLEDGRWNPLFHGVSILIYAFAPDSARAFYFAQWLMLLVTSACIAWIVVRVTGTAVLAWLGVVLFCTASSVFENYYTLDKVEPRIAVFSALLVTLFVSQYFVRISEKKVDRSWRWIAVQLVLGVAVVFSKETGVFLAAAFFAAWLASLLNSSISTALRKLAFEFFVVQLIVIVAYLGLFKALAPPMSYRYVVYDISVTLLVRNVSYYLLSSPELTVSVLVAIYWLVRSVFAKLPGPDGTVQFLLAFLSFALLGYFLGICLWRWPLDYYLLPAHLLSALLIAVTIGAAIRDRWPRAHRWEKLAAAFLCALWCAFYVYRVAVGIAIFSFDAVKDDLAQRLSDPAFYARRLIVPLRHPDNAEVGERLEFFINRQRPVDQAGDLYNFWEFPYEGRKDLARFSGAAGISPSATQLRSVANDINHIVIWKFGENERAYTDALKKNVEGMTVDELEAERSSAWHFSFVRPGDLIIAPVGSSLFRWVRARGLGMHTKSVDEFVQNTPLVLKSLASISRGMGPLWLGWEVFEVVSNVDFGKGGYNIFTLRQLNKPRDISPSNALESLARGNRLPEAGIFLGTGWYDLETQGGLAFHWMGRRSELVLTRLPVGKCSIELDVEPILDASAKPFQVSLTIGDKTEGRPLSGRERIAFDFLSNGEDIQVVKVNAIGGTERQPKNDTRSLKMRAFELGAPQCIGSAR